MGEERDDTSAFPASYWRDRAFKAESYQDTAQARIAELEATRGK
jgi:hypothetical protein